MDALTYAGNLENLDDVISHDRLRFIRGDIRDIHDVTEALDGVDVIVNAAAESHVSKSIEQGGAEFVTTNVVGTQVLLDAIRERPVERFILISSSEVYGTAESDPMSEDHPLNPRSPYAGTKAGGDRLAYSYWCTYDLPITVIRPFNNYGPYQHPGEGDPAVHHPGADRPAADDPRQRPRQPRLAARVRHGRGDHAGPARCRWSRSTARRSTSPPESTSRSSRSRT